MRVQATIAGRVLRTRAAAALAALAALAAVSVLLAGCGGSGPPPAAVPSLGQGASGTGASGTAVAAGSRAARLHAAAQCIRQHGVPGYADPVLTPGGAVYSDLRPIQNASQPTLAAVAAACRALVVAAGLNPGNEPPAPPQLVQAGVRAAQCERAHGLPNVQDPTARTSYTPGHGFGMTGNEIPAGGKQSQGFQEAGQACHRQMSAEIRASTLSSLGSDG
jgi:hypothetical protein